MKVSIDFKKYKTLIVIFSVTLIGAGVLIFFCIQANANLKKALEKKKNLQREVGTLFKNDFLLTSENEKMSLDGSDQAKRQLLTIYEGLRKEFPKIKTDDMTDGDLKIKLRSHLNQKTQDWLELFSSNEISYTSSDSSFGFGLYISKDPGTIEEAKYLLRRSKIVEFLINRIIDSRASSVDRIDYEAKDEKVYLPLVEGKELVEIKDESGKVTKDTVKMESFYFH